MIIYAENGTLRTETAALTIEQAKALLAEGNVAVLHDSDDYALYESPEAFLRDAQNAEENALFAERYFQAAFQCFTAEEWAAYEKAYFQEA